MKDLEISLRAARVNADLSLQDAAKALNITEATLEAWENGTEDMTVFQARRLSEVYRISIDNIFFGA